MDLKFKVETACPDTHARLARYQTAHGEVQTPVFMPVGTTATVKGLSPEDLEAAGASVILGNTYHLGIRPGVDTLKALGGMHSMAQWRRPILTDSGGFQVLSLAHRRKVSEEGVRFQNHIDGATLNLTPEHSIEIQEAIGSDIMMCLDHLEAATEHRRVHEKAIERTTRWALRCLEARTRPDRAVFGILQGGVDFELRTRHIEQMCGHDFDGFAIGGLSVGESIETMYEVMAHAVPQMPKDKPRYLMGVGTPKDLVEGVANGVDMFDCVMPTRNARKGGIFVDRGRRKINMKNAKFRDQDAPMDPDCRCHTCQNYSAGYLRHLLKLREFNANRLLSIHNVHLYLELMREMRRAIRQGRFAAFYREWRSGLPAQ